jgi:hypothetical protein
MRVEKLSWDNDDIISLDALIAEGLTVQLDQEPSSPVNGANFIVTLETADVAPANDLDTQVSATPADIVDAQLAPAATDIVDAQLATVKAVAARQTLTVRGLVVLDVEVSPERDRLKWKLPNESGAQKKVLEDLDALILLGARVGRWARVRVRLLGHAIFATSASGTLFLDGQAFGESAVRADEKTPRIALHMPSGQQQRASDLDSWFYLAPALRVTSVKPNSNRLRVTAHTEDDVIVEATGTEKNVTPDATGYLNYPVVAATRVELAVTAVMGSAGIDAIVSVPSSVKVEIGKASFPIPIKILANPDKTVEFTLSALLTDASGTHTCSSETIALEGMGEDKAT